MTLKLKKACGVDDILNEMIKYTDLKFQLAILKLLNSVLSSRIFPNIWNQELMSPIHKRGDKLDSNNYRGVCVNSNLAEILWMIIFSRLLNFLTDNNAISKKQFGYLLNDHTTDQSHIKHPH